MQGKGLGAPAAAWEEHDTAQEERPEHCLWQLSPCSSSVIISQFLCFCMMQCKFLEAAILTMEDQLVVISGELTWLYPVVTESDPEVVYMMSRDRFFH